MSNTSTFKEHDVVTMLRDRPDVGLRAGDVGAIVHCYASGEDFEVDFVDEHGRSKGVHSLHATELLRLNLTSLVA